MIEKELQDYMDLFKKSVGYNEELSAEFTKKVEPIIARIYEVMTSTNSTLLDDFANSKIYKPDGEFYNAVDSGRVVALYWKDKKGPSNPDKTKATIFVVPKSTFVSDDVNVCTNAFVYAMYSKRRESLFEELTRQVSKMRDYEEMINSLLREENDVLKSVDINTPEK